MKTWSSRLWICLALLLPMIACDIPDFGLGGNSEPPAPPTPLGDTLSLLVPIYSVTLQPGGSVPGTALKYVGSVDGTHEVTIDGLTAVKRTGDSFSWKGVVAPGVIGAYNLRLTTTLLGKLVAAGPVNVTIFNPDPQPLTSTGDSGDFDLRFSNIAVQYLVPEQRIIPGTSLTFARIIEPGDPSQDVAQTMVELRGSGGYPFYALGDSLVWVGKLRPNVTIRYSLRIIQIDEHGLRVGGTADLWVAQ